MAMCYMNLRPEADIKAVLQDYRKDTVVANFKEAITCHIHLTKQSDRRKLRKLGMQCKNMTVGVH